MTNQQSWILTIMVPVIAGALALVGVFLKHWLENRNEKSAEKSTYKEMEKYARLYHKLNMICHRVLQTLTAKRVNIVFIENETPLLPFINKKSVRYKTVYIDAHGENSYTLMYINRHPLGDLLSGILEELSSSENTEKIIYLKDMPDGKSHIIDQMKADGGEKLVIKKLFSSKSKLFSMLVLLEDPKNKEKLGELHITAFLNKATTEAASILSSMQDIENELERQRRSVKE